MIFGSGRVGIFSSLFGVVFGGGGGGEAHTVGGCEKWRVAPVSRPPKYALSLFLLSRLAGCWSSTVIFPSFLLFLLLF